MLGGVRPQAPTGEPASGQPQGRHVGVASPTRPGHLRQRAVVSDLLDDRKALIWAEAIEGPAFETASRDRQPSVREHRADVDGELRGPAHSSSVRRGWSAHRRKSGTRAVYRILELTRNNLGASCPARPVPSPQSGGARSNRCAATISSLTGASTATMPSTAATAPSCTSPDPARTKSWSRSGSTAS